MQPPVPKSIEALNRQRYSLEEKTMKTFRLSTTLAALSLAAFGPTALAQNQPVDTTPPRRTDSRGTSGVGNAR